MIPIITGNILQTDKLVIVQQVNARQRMASGLAKQIMDKYSNVRDEYIAFCKAGVKHARQSGNLAWDADPDETLLGQVNFVPVYDGKIIANVFGQLDCRDDEEDTAVFTITDALIKGLEAVKDKAKSDGLSVAIPTFIGCGLANGDWSEILPLIEKVFDGSGVDVVFYHYEP